VELGGLGGGGGCGPYILVRIGRVRRGEDVEAT
jgi:hypothetical protein